MRINKYIADCGVASRRSADKLVSEGRVKVNGRTITELGYEIREENDTVWVDGNKIALVKKMIYVMFNKPKGCVCTVKDESDKDRKTIMDYIKIRERVYPIGRLDYDTEGLLLLTNDGTLSYKLTHPSQDIPKVYLVKVEGEVQESDLAALRNGIEMDGIQLHRAKLKLKESVGNIFSYEVTIFEGRNRQIRRMFEYIEKEVVFLKRIAMGEIKLGGLSRGATRDLNQKEMKYIAKIIEKKISEKPDEDEDEVE